MGGLYKASLTGSFLLIGFLCLYHIMGIRVPYDEGDLIWPAINHMMGREYPYPKYPTFPFIFYESFFRVYAFLFPDPPFHHIARFVNWGLYLLNAFLMKKIADRIFPSWWSLLAVLLFSLSPGVYYSGVVVKTESLLLTEMFLVIYCCQKLLEEKDPRPIWHMLAGVGCGLAVSTKYQPFLPIIYLVTLAQPIRENKFMDRLKGHFRTSSPYVFGLAFMLTILLTWTTLWRFLEVPGTYLTEHPYFNPFPSSSKAVSEGGISIYGRYGYAFWAMIPMAAGFFTYIFGLMGMFWVKNPGPIMVALKIFGVVFLLATLNLTLHRVPYLFTLLNPVLVLFCVAFWKKIGERIPSMFLSLIIVGQIVAALMGHSMLVLAARGVMEIMKTGEGIPASLQRGGNILYLMDSKITLKRGIMASEIDQEILTKRPQYIYAFDSYLYNFCKYKNSPSYLRQCRFFQDLIQEKLFYKVVWKKAVDYPFKKWVSIDPESSLTFYLFQLK